MNEGTGYWCVGCGTPLEGRKWCGGANCINMAVETGQGWGADKPRRSPTIPRERKPAADVRLELACADTIYVEAASNRTVLLRSVYKNDSGESVLTTEEARILANVLLAAVVESEGR
jgi:hypothetical protein